MISRDERPFGTSIRALSDVHHDVNGLQLSLLI
jgi:hypothetical protein